MPKKGHVNHIFIEMNISAGELKELTELIEDTIEYACDKLMLSGETAWTVSECLAVAKLAELKGLVSADAE